MQKNLKYLSFNLFVFLLLINFGCKKNTDTKSEDASIDALEQVEAAVSPVFENDTNIYERLSSLQSQILNINGVKDLQFNHEGLSVLFENDNVASWGAMPNENEWDLDSIDVEFDKNSLSNPQAYKSAVIFSPITDFTENLSFGINSMENKVGAMLQNAGWNVDVLEGKDASYAAASQLGGYDLAVIYAHGAIYDFTQNGIKKQFQGFLTATSLKESDFKTSSYYNDWTKGIIWPHYKNGKVYIIVTHKFFSEKYSTNSLNNIFYFASCNSGTWDLLSNSILDKGAKAVFTWNGSNRIGIKASYPVVKNLIYDLSVGDAFELLASRYKVDHCLNCGYPEGNGPATLKYNVRNNDDPYKVFLNDFGNPQFFDLYLDNLVWESPLNGCEMETGSMGSSYDLNLYCSQYFPVQNRDFKVEVYGLFENRVWDYDYGYANSSWVEIDDYNNAVKLNLCTYFGVADYSKMKVVISNSQYRSYAISLQLDRPSGANKTDSGFQCNRPN